jgi:CubicO group peptidase (beta-lactamase class C family)
MKENYIRPTQIVLGILTAMIILLQTLQSKAQALPDSLGILVKNYYESSMFNGFVRVEKKGKILLNQSYGMADYEKLVSITADSRFRLGSLSKQFTAYIILNLAQEGKLNLTDSLAKYFPEYRSASSVTINQLLHHTAGIPNFTDFKDYDSIKSLEAPSDLIVLRRVENLPLDFEPGTNYNYSNSGYVLLAMIAEKVTGNSWEQLTRKYIVRPASLTNTGVEENRIKDKIIPGYGEDLNAMNNVADQINVSIAKGGGNNFSSASDLSKWLNYLMNDNKLNDASKNSMFSPEKENYAKGWEVFHSDNHKAKIIYHSGGIDGFRTAIVMIPGYDIRKLPFQILDIVLGKSVKLPLVKNIQKVDAKLLSEYQGEYLLNGKLPVQIILNDSNLFIQFPNQPAVRLYSEGNDRFFTMAVEASISFNRNDVGKIETFTFQQGSAKMDAKRKE